MSNVKSFRDRLYKSHITCAEALVYKCRITADKVYSAGVSCSLEGLCELYCITVRAGCSKYGDRSNGDTLVNDRYAVC